MLAADVNPPVWREFDDAYDLLYPWRPQFAVGAFTSANFDNGDGTAELLFGRARIMKDGHDVYLQGIVTVPVAVGAWGFALLSGVPLTYLPPLRRGIVQTIKSGFWGGTAAIATVTVFNDGNVYLDNGPDVNHLFPTSVTTTFTYNAHGLANGQPVVFKALTGGAGLSLNTIYYVINVATNTFQLSATVGGASVTVTTNATFAVIVPKATFAIVDAHWRTQTYGEETTLGE